MNKTFRAAKNTKVIGAIISVILIGISAFLLIYNKESMQLIIMFLIVVLLMNISIHSFGIDIRVNKLVIHYLLFSKTIICSEIVYIGKQRFNDNPFEKKIYLYVIKCRNENIEKSFGIPKLEKFEDFIQDIHLINGAIDIDY
jgi:hypothetical protein